MKKIFVFLMSLVMMSSILFASAFNVNVAEKEESNIISETTEYYEDGTYATVTVIDESPIIARSTAYTKTGTKNYVLFNKDGEELWRFIVHGTFSVNFGVSATCTNASYTINITESAWKNDSASAYTSGNQAIGSASFVKKILFITTDRSDCQVILTCDSDGNLS